MKEEGKRSRGVWGEKVVIRKWRRVREMRERKKRSKRKRRMARG